MSSEAVSGANFKRVKGERGGLHIFTTEDKQLYKRKNASGTTTYYECCRKDCFGAVKEVGQVISVHKSHTVSHVDQEQDFLVFLFRETLSEEAVKCKESVETTTPDLR
jgi:hypothetical protein